VDLASSAGPAGAFREVGFADLAGHRPGRRNLWSGPYGRALCRCRRAQGRGQSAAAPWRPAIPSGQEGQPCHRV